MTSPPPEDHGSAPEAEDSPVVPPTPHSAHIRAAQVRSMLWMAALPLLWGPLMALGLHLDPLATRAVELSGVVAGGAMIALAVFVMRRLRDGVRPASTAACARDLAVGVTVCSLARWVLDQSDPRVPYIEAVSVLAATLALGWAACLGLFMTVHPLGRGQVADAGDRPPGLRTLYVTGAGALGLLVSVVLGIGLSARAAGDGDRARMAELGAVADLMAVALPRIGPEATLDLLDGQLYMDGLLMPQGETPAVVSLADLEVEAGGGRLLLFGEARFHLVVRATAEGTLWVWQTAGVGAPVRAPDDASAILILALLMLGAPLGAWLIGQDAIEQLRPITEALDRMGQPSAGGRERPAEVPEGSNDEIGDLAAVVNDTVRRFTTRNTQLAGELGAATGSDQTRTGFLHAASYELRTPLTTIAGYCHLLRQTELNDAQREDIRVIDDATAQLQSHVDEILDLSRIETGAEVPLAIAPVDLVALAREALDGQTARVAPDVTAQVIAEDPPSGLKGDATRLRQVIDNLVGNALKFTESGYVEVRVGRCRLDGQPAARLDVIDTGPGIPADELERIFVEFHRVADRRDVAGTGLGLAIARRLVERHGGRLWATSVEGEGSTFHLLLPVEPTREGSA